MRPCPSCGSLKRVQLAPWFFECRGTVDGAKTGEEVDETDCCGTRYLDTSDSQTSSPPPFGEGLGHFLEG